MRNLQIVDHFQIKKPCLMMAFYLYRPQRLSIYKLDADSIYPLSTLQTFDLLPMGVNPAQLDEWQKFLMFLRKHHRVNAAVHFFHQFCDSKAVSKTEKAVHAWPSIYRWHCWWFQDGSFWLTHHLRIQFILIRSSLLVTDNSMFLYHSQSFCPTWTSMVGIIYNNLHHNGWQLDLCILSC